MGKKTLSKIHDDRQNKDHEAKMKKIQECAGLVLEMMCERGFTCNDGFTVLDFAKRTLEYQASERPLSDLKLKK